MRLSFDLPISFLFIVYCLFLNLFCFYVLLYLCVSSSTFSSSLLCSFLCLSLIVVNFLPSLCPIFSVNHSDFLPVFLSICLSVLLLCPSPLPILSVNLSVYLSLCFSVLLLCPSPLHILSVYLSVYLSICLSFCFYVQFFLTRVYLALKIAGKFFMLVVNRKVKLVPSLIDEFRLPNCKSKSKILLACGREISVLTSCGGWVG